MIGNTHSLSTLTIRRPHRLYALLLLFAALFALLAPMPAARGQLLLPNWQQREALAAARRHKFSPRPPIIFPQGVRNVPARPLTKILVKLQPGVDPTDFSHRFALPNRAVLGNQVENKAAAPLLKPLRSLSHLGWHVFQLPNTSLLPETLAALRSHRDVLRAEPDYPLKRLTPPNDFYWGKEDLEHLIVVLSGLAGINDARDYDSSSWTYTWSLETVHAQQAWENYPGFYPTAANRVAQLSSDPSRLPLVGVIDSGIDLKHPDFSYTGNPSHGTNDTDVVNGGQIAKALARDLIGGNTDPNPLLAMDDVGHGTSVSGIIGAAPNNTIGIPGLGFPARIVPIKVIDADGNGEDSDLIDAIMYAADVHCLVVNISLNLDTTDYPQALQDAVDYAWQHGTLIVAAAGNDANPSIPLLGQTRRYPASLVHVLAVAASAFGGPDVIGGEQRASYSNYGNSLGVTAPGGDITTFVNTSQLGAELGLDPIQEYVLIWTLAPTYQVLLSDPDPANPDGLYAALGLYGLNYGALPGTSLAAPHVVGLVALYAAKNQITQSTPNAPQLLINAIERGCEQMNRRADGGFDPNWGYGRIDALATLLGTNARNTTVGGLIGQVTFGGTPIHNIQVVATQIGPLKPKKFFAVTAPDGIFHLINMPAGDYMLLANVFGQTRVITATVVAGSDQHGINIAIGTPQPPAPPTNLTATPGDQQVTLNWTGSSGATAYNVKRSTTMGGPYTIIASPTTTTYTNTGLTNGTKYYYVVTAFNSSGESANSNEASATPTGNSVSYKINAGGGAVGTFTADANFSGGTVYSFPDNIDTSGVTNPAPVGVYQTLRYIASGSFSYNLPNLTGGGNYKVRLHFTEPYYDTGGHRLTNVSINGTTVLSNYSPFTAAGGRLRAAIAEVTVSADNTGTLNIVVSGTDSPLLCGLEVIPQ